MVSNGVKTATRLKAVMAAGGALALAWLTSAAKAQTYDVIPLTDGTMSSSVKDINNRGDVLCSFGLSLYRGERMSRRIVAVPGTARAFSPDGTLLACDNGVFQIYLLRDAATNVVNATCIGLIGDYPQIPTRVQQGDELYNSFYSTQFSMGFTATGVSDDGILVGTMFVFSGGSGQHRGYYTNIWQARGAWGAEGFIRSGNNGAQLPFQESYVTSINNSGRVAAYGTRLNETGDMLTDFAVADQYYNAWGTPIWNSYGLGSTRQVSLDPGRVFDINENGVSAGSFIASFTPDASGPAYYNNANPAGPSNIPLLGQTSFVPVTGYHGEARGINDNGEMVGWSHQIGDATKTPRPFLYRNGKTKNINELLAGTYTTVYIGGKPYPIFIPSPWTILSVVDINNNGDIAANARMANSTIVQAVLLKRR